MSAGKPNYEQVAKGLVETNNQLRAKLGMEPRDLASLSWQKIADDVREENRELVDKVNNPPKEKKARRGRPPKEETNEEPSKKEEKTADTDESAE